MDTPRSLLVAPLAVLAAFGAAPLLLLLGGAAVPAASAGPPTHPFSPGEVLPLLGTSLLLAGLSASLATAVAVVPGIALGRSDLRGRHLWTVALALPLVLPPALTAAGWRPWLDVWLNVAGTGFPARLLAASMVLTLLTFPVPLFLTALSLRHTDRALEDVARLYGGRTTEVRSLVVRLARPGITLGWLLVFLLGLSESAVAELAGVPSYAARLEQLVHDGSRAAAGLATVPLVLLAAAAAVLESRLFGERGVAFLARAVAVDPAALPLGRFRRAVTGGLAVLAAAALLGPLAGWTADVLGAARPERALRWAWETGLPAFARSLVFGLAAASLAVAIGLPLAYATERSGQRRSSAVDPLLVVLFAVPGAVLALGLLQLLPFSFFRASAAALVVALAVKLAVVAYRIERVGLRRLGTTLEEAGMLAGAGWRVRVRDLVLPLNAELLVATWMATLLLAFRDVGAASALSPAAPVLPALGGEAAGRIAGGAGALGLAVVAAAALTLLLSVALSRRLGSAGRRPDAGALLEVSAP